MNKYVCKKSCGFFVKIDGKKYKRVIKNERLKNDTLG